MFLNLFAYMFTVYLCTYFLIRMSYIYEYCICLPYICVRIFSWEWAIYMSIVYVCRMFVYVFSRKNELYILVLYIFTVYLCTYFLVRMSYVLQSMCVYLCCMDVCALHSACMCVPYKCVATYERVFFLRLSYICEGICICVPYRCLLLDMSSREIELPVYHRWPPARLHWTPIRRYVGNIVSLTTVMAEEWSFTGISGASS